MVFALIGAVILAAKANHGNTIVKKGYGVTKTDLKVAYPPDFECPPLTSFYASWIDVDGTHRDEIHTGVDGGRLGDWVLAPASGTVRAVWEANWKWGPEGALLLKHTSEDVNADEAAPIYYSAFDHLSYDEIKHFKPGDKISRGQRLARVHRPGSVQAYLPEVHWEVWEVKIDELVWHTNRYKAQEWANKSSELIDPLYMLALHDLPSEGKTAMIVPFENGTDYSDFRGFTYILECRRK